MSSTAGAQALFHEPVEDGDERLMRLALEQAQQASRQEEVPVGAVVVQRHADGSATVLAAASNAPIATHDPTAHAEVRALREAARIRGNYRLDDCELFVTLEPCAMCAQAALHARVGRVVYGAREPKTGAAGSVLDLFALPELNHRTRVTGGVLADASAELLQLFFRDCRAAAKRQASPLREDAVRAPETCFDALPGYPWQPNYISDLATLGGLRMHHIDEGPRDAPVTWLCLHSSPTWSYLYRKMVPVFLAHGGRVVAPDLIGFGRSDKPKKPGAHTGSWHRDALLEWIERLDLRNVVLVLHGDAGVLGLTLPLAAAHRYHGLLAMNALLPSETPTPDAAGACEQHPPWKHNPDLRVGDLLARSHPQLRPAERAAYDAPFPDRGHRAVLRASPMDQPLPGLARETQAFWQHRWSGRSMIAISAQGAMPEGIAPGSLLRAVRHGDQHLTLPEAGYWIPEQGEGLALQACRFFAH